MNIFMLGVLAYAGSQLYKKAKRTAFSLSLLVPNDWAEVDEGMYRSVKSDKAFVILHKTPEEVLSESEQYPAEQSNLPGKMVKKDEETFIYFYIDQKNNQGYVIGFSNMNIFEINMLCSTIKPL